MNLIVNTDGASRGNPGRASYGYVLKTKDGVILHEEGKYIGMATNNFAEYTAVLEALLYIDKKYSHKLPHRIEIVSDSELIVRQLLGRYKLKSANLKHLHESIKIIAAKLGVVNYKSIPRKDNFIADRLANKALDA